MSLNEIPSSTTAIPLASYSQWGDDLKVWEYFGRKRSGIFLEAGANDPKVLSQTYFLECQGWSGILIEPAPECCEQLRAERPRSQVFQNALGAPDQRGVLRLRAPGGVVTLAAGMTEGEQVGIGDRVFESAFITLNEVLEMAGILQLDYLSLDLEGMELEALKGLDFNRHAPRLIVMEDRLDHLDKHRFLKQAGYKLVLRNGSNNWYVPVPDSFPVTLPMRLKLFRKLYLSMPFRRLRDCSRHLRGKAR